MERPRHGDPLIIALIVVMSVVELTLWASDQGIIQRGLRELAYHYGAFWPGILTGWTANYPAQPFLMFVTYAFLHGGLGHLAMNMVTLWSVGRVVLDRVGRARFGAIYLASALGAAAGFAALWPDPYRPMVGASGALFGLAGAFLAWEYVDRFSERSSLWPVARVVGLLIALNVVMWASLKGQLAWQAHLGGFVAGWVMATLIDPVPRVLVEEGDDDAGSA